MPFKKPRVRITDLKQIGLSSCGWYEQQPADRRAGRPHIDGLMLAELSIAHPDELRGIGGMGLLLSQAGPGATFIAISRWGSDANGILAYCPRRKSRWLGIRAEGPWTPWASPTAAGTIAGLYAPERIEPCPLEGGFPWLGLLTDCTRTLLTLMGGEWRIQELLDAQGEDLAHDPMDAHEIGLARTLRQAVYTGVEGMPAYVCPGHLISLIAAVGALAEGRLTKTVVRNVVDALRRFELPLAAAGVTVKLPRHVLMGRAA